jgi:hypothetical protein
MSVNEEPRITPLDAGMSSSGGEPLPPYSYVPGGPWPHPTRSPGGHLHGRPREAPAPIQADDWEASHAYRRGLELFNAGFYWEAHEAWEALWHAEGRTGPTAWVLQALIKLAAAGVKVREHRPEGVRRHAAGATLLLERARQAGGPSRLGLDLDALIARARELAAAPPAGRPPRDVPVVRVLRFALAPGQSHDGPASVTGPTLDA